MNLTRRDALTRIFTAAALAASLDLTACGADGDLPAGYDPNLLKKEIWWNRVLTDAEKRAVTALADVIIPADEFGPAASAVGVTDFIDEWVSAPYEPQQADLKTIRPGLEWLDAEAKKQGKVFAELTEEQKTAIVDLAIKDQKKFWQLIRDRVCGGYYSTPEGWKALGYTGNLPMAEFPGPPPEALKHIGIE